jgi:uncharacterized membrane protein
MVAWILIAIIILLIIFGIIAILATKKGKKKPTDYYSLFVMGIIWLPLGIVFMINDYSLGNIFFILGLVYMIMGLAHKKEWKKNRQPNLIKDIWLRWIVAGLLALLIAVGIVFYLRYR